MPKRIHDQVIVITGASSGIGRETALLAGDKGARVVLSGRNEEALEHVRDEIEKNGGSAVVVRADVASEQDVRGIAQTAIEQFGGIDTWVNNAGVSIYGTMLEVPIEDQRKLFETNYWGVVNGSLEAVRQMRSRGGVIINIGSTLSDFPMPLQGAYSASKHAVRGFTDALRMELRHEGIPVHVCLIKPGAIDTPYPQHARNYMEYEPQNPPPLYSANVVAKAILHCAVHPRRDVFVGGGGKAISLFGNMLPHLADAVMSRFMTEGQKSSEPVSGNGQDGLYAPSREIGVQGTRRSGPVFNRSLYTAATLHPVATGAAAALGALALARLLNPRPRGDLWS